MSASDAPRGALSTEARGCATCQEDAPNASEVRASSKVVQGRQLEARSASFHMRPRGGTSIFNASLIMSSAATSAEIAAAGIQEAYYFEFPEDGYDEMASPADDNVITPSPTPPTPEPTQEPTPEPTVEPTLVPDKDTSE